MGGGRAVLQAAGAWGTHAPAERVSAAGNLQPQPPSRLSSGGGA